MTDITAYAAASTGGGGSAVRANAAVESVDFKTRVAVVEYLPLGGKLMFCQDCKMRTLLCMFVDRLAQKGSYLVMCCSTIFIVYLYCSAIPVAARAKAWTCDRSIAGI